MENFFKDKIFLFFVIIFAFLVRIYGINWDNQFHLHPDERMIMIVTQNINFFSNLDPQFYNYGTLPIYILKFIAQLLTLFTGKDFESYSNILLLARILSTIVDTLTCIVIFKISYQLFKKNSIAVFSTLTYSISFFPIQNSNFFIVDVFLTFFVSLLLFSILKFISTKKSGKTNDIFYITILGIITGAIVATKFTGIIFIVPIIITLIYKIFLKEKKIIEKIKTLFIQNLQHILVSFFSFFVFMPYGVLKFEKVTEDLALQTQMNSDPYIFPFTLQYIDSLPYLYHIKNIFLWGIGPFITIFVLTGLVFFIIKIFINNSSQKDQEFIERILFLIKSKKEYILVIITYLIYFIIIGRSSVKFMRYMLPLYPFFAILSGYSIYKLYNLNSNMKFYDLFIKLFVSLNILFCFVWSFAFLNIYSHEHTRISATNWILNNIPEGSTLAVEHWDDRVPMFTDVYNFEELELYNQPDDIIKFDILNEQLQRSDYIVIASNRLYDPIMYLEKCIPERKRCYPYTAKYYKDLFNGKSEFELIKEFEVKPGLNIFGLKFQINDQSADESFTVYDHPKIFIFKKKDI